MNKLFIDLDGVMADFDTYFVSHFQTNHKKLTEIKMWEMIEAHGSFFKDLPPCAGAIEFFNEIKDRNPIILTACPKTFYHNSALQKRKWVREHLSTDVLILPILGGKNKALFMHNYKDILIDDFESNCVSWRNYGGYAIEHKTFELTSEILDRLDRLEKGETILATI